MNLFKNFFKVLNGGRPRGNFHPFSVKCKRCGEVIQGRVNIWNDPSLELDEKDRPYYVCRKVLIGSGGTCFQQIEVIFKFDEGRRVLDRQITGGEFVEKV
jgi:hypothetical protein